MVTINCFDITQIQNEDIELLWKLIPQERRDKVKKYIKKDDVKRSICAEILIWFSIKQLYGHNLKCNVSYNKYGKPYISNLKNFHFNISHSGKWVVIAYGSKQIGIDIEKVEKKVFRQLQIYFLMKKQIT